MYHDDGGCEEWDNEGYDEFPIRSGGRRGKVYVPYETEPRTPIEPSGDPSLWVTWTGTVLRLADMSDLHLARALAKTVEKDNIEHARAKALLAELTKRSYGEPQTADLPSNVTCTTIGGGVNP
jgi:hypothetical protein